MSCVLRTQLCPVERHSRVCRTNAVPHKGQMLHDAGRSGCVPTATIGIPRRYDRLPLARDDDWTWLLVTEGRPSTNPVVQPARRLGG